MADADWDEGLAMQAVEAGAIGKARLRRTDGFARPPFAGWPDWLRRQLLGITGLCVCGIISLGLTLVVSSVPAFVSLDSPAPLADRVRWFLSVSGGTTWCPLSVLFCLRRYLRHGWSFTIPIVLCAALALSAIETIEAWRACAPGCS